MNKKFASAVLIGLCSLGLFAQAHEKESSKNKGTFKGNVLLGSYILETTDDSQVQFGGAYALADIMAGNQYFTAGGKIYYRVKLYDDSKDQNTDKTLAQEVELKRAYVRVRPFGNEMLEFSLGKLYSYYFPGNYLSISELYTGAGRWGKTGAGVKFEKYGVTLGAAIPVTESYVEFGNSFGLNLAAGYNFAEVFSNVPVTLSADVLWNKTHTETKAKTGEITSSDTDDWIYGVSANYAPKLNGFVSKLNSTVTFSWNAEPYVASSVFKNVSNYSEADLKKCWFFSVNHRNNFGPVQFILEGEAGHSVQGNMTPIYGAVQLLVPVIEHVAFKPRFYYYAAINSADFDSSRQTFEIYPRLWLTFDRWTVSAGYDIDFKQTDKDNWQFQWNIPVYVEYKF